MCKHLQEKNTNLCKHLKYSCWNKSFIKFIASLLWKSLPKGNQSANGNLKVVNWPVVNLVPEALPSWHCRQDGENRPTVKLLSTQNHLTLWCYWNWAPWSQDKTNRLQCRLAVSCLIKIWTRKGLIFYWSKNGFVICFFNGALQTWEIIAPIFPMKQPSNLRIVASSSLWWNCKSLYSIFRRGLRLCASSHYNYSPFLLVKE